MVVALTINQNLSCFREGVVVLGAHARAISSCPTDDQEVTDPWPREGSWAEGLGLPRDAGDEVSRFATVANLVEGGYRGGGAAAVNSRGREEEEGISAPRRSCRSSRHRLGGRR
jgi:hypothetical protein